MTKDDQELKVAHRELEKARKLAGNALKDHRQLLVALRAADAAIIRAMRKSNA